MQFLVMLLTVVVAVVILTCNGALASYEPSCGYENSEGEVVYLKYFPNSKKSEEYVDFGSGAGGPCLRRVICTGFFETQIDECSSAGVSCENKSQFKGVFPACCVKC